MNTFESHLIFLSFSKVFKFDNNWISSSGQQYIHLTPSELDDLTVKYQDTHYYIIGAFNGEPVLADVKINDLGSIKLQESFLETASTCDIYGFIKDMYHKKIIALRDDDSSEDENSEISETSLEARFRYEVGVMKRMLETNFNKRDDTDLRRRILNSIRYTLDDYHHISPTKEVIEMLLSFFRSDVPLYHLGMNDDNWGHVYPEFYELRHHILQSNPSFIQVSDIFCIYHDNLEFALRPEFKDEINIPYKKIHILQVALTGLFYKDLNSMNKVLEKLLDAGVDPNYVIEKKDRSIFNDLLVISERLDISTLKILFDHGLRCDSKNKKGEYRCLPLLRSMANEISNKEVNDLYLRSCLINKFTYGIDGNSH